MRLLVWPAAAIAAITGALVADGWSAMGRRADGTRRARMERSPQWKGGRFVSPQPLQNDTWLALRDVLFTDAPRVPGEPVRVETVDPERFAARAPSGLRVTWLGHSTLLVELDGRRILVDPMWGERASTFSWAGPRRWYPPLIPLDRLPVVDAVVISHDHYDHLDASTIRAMREWKTTFVVPLGVGAHLAYWGVPEARIVELDWWERTALGDLEIVATPARHASGRSLLARDRTLWAGFAFIGPEHRAFYSGDTGLFPGLAEIGARLGPFDVAMVEAGAYGRAWPDWHLGPEQAVRASQLVKGRTLLPIHWALFNLAPHGWTEPAERVLAAARQAGVTVLLPRPGESVEPVNPPAAARWWPEVPWKTAAEAPIVSTMLDERTGRAGERLP
jgi:L-ascorbate metabolism protein UlaG (beta-lactamase superfamily)